MIGVPFLAVGGGSSAYQIANSLRFRASNSAFLSRSVTASNRKTFTVSLWVKRGEVSVGTASWLFQGTVLQGNGLGFTGPSWGTASDRLVCSFNGSIVFETSAVYRDPTAWYHVVLAVDTTQATAANRVRLYVNGSEVTSFASTAYPAQNTDLGWNATDTAYIGRLSSVPYQFDGQIAEFYNIVGQQLTPGVFAQIDPATSSWVPRAYGGTYPTGSYFLPFNDATSTTTISQDRSGNGNNWTSSGISVTAGVTFDQMTDTPTNNFATLSSIRANSGTLSAANLDIPVVASSISNAATWTLTSGKWYFEVTSGTASGGYPIIGAYDASGAASFSSAPGQSGGTNGVSYWSNGTRAINGASTTSWGATFAAGDVIGIAIDADTGRIWFAKNGVWQASGDPAAGTSPAGTMTSGQYTPGAAAQVGTSSSFNFGQRPFAYTPPTGFVALNTKNLPTPTIKRGDDGFAVLTRAGSNSPVAVTGLRFAPDFVWTKSRNTADHHNVADKVRGTSLNLQTSNTNAEDALGILTAFNSDGYTLGGGFGRTNAVGQNFVDWVAREGAAYGFDIVTYTGNGTSGRTVAHGLGAVPHFVVVKRRSGVAIGWAIYHRNQAATPQNNSMSFDTTATVVDAAAWNSTAPTSSVITLGNGAAVNLNTETYVAYLWTSIPGFSLFGAYTGNGSADGPFVWCGFRPRFLMIKRVDSTGGWWMVDTARFPNNQITNAALTANSSAAEGGSGYGLDITAGGFKPRDVGSDYNVSGGTYIFAAFAETPFKYANAR